MKKYYSFMTAFAVVLCMGVVSCSDDDNNSNNVKFIDPATITDNSTYVNELTTFPVNTDFTNNVYGTTAIGHCTDLVTQLEAANSIIGKASLTDEQTAYLKEVLGNVVDNVIVPTYKSLADNTERLENVLKDLTAETITQEKINTACEYFGEARSYWELSEAFLGGAASDFDIDPTIDSWPLSRTLLLNYLTSNQLDEEMLDDASILGFHALEFVLFRNGQPRNVAELKGQDTYTGFENISGATELTYAQQVCKLLKERTFQLQVAWEGATTSNAARVSVVNAANLDYLTAKGQSYGYNLKHAGESNSTFASLKAAVAQVLSDDEGSAAAIANEVGTAKIANPFSNGTISYVESPYSYRSIIDFQDNIRSVRNIWYGSVDGERDSKIKSFYSFFLSVENASQNKTNIKVVDSFANSINAIGSMPAPFVKYCCTIWGKEFSEE